MTYKDKATLIALALLMAIPFFNYFKASISFKPKMEKVYCYYFKPKTSGLNDKFRYTCDDSVLNDSIYFTIQLDEVTKNEKEYWFEIQRDRNFVGKEDKGSEKTFAGVVKSIGIFGLLSFVGVVIFLIKTYVSKLFSFKRKRVSRKRRKSKPSYEPKFSDDFLEELSIAMRNRRNF